MSEDTNPEVALKKYMGSVRNSEDKKPKHKK
jgi:hypothetical protein